jgi:hypothetical protein
MDREKEKRLKEARLAEEIAWRELIESQAKYVH